MLQGPNLANSTIQPLCTFVQVAYIFSLDIFVSCFIFFVRHSLDQLICSDIDLLLIRISVGIQC